MPTEPSLKPLTIEEARGYTGARVQYSTHDTPEFGFIVSTSAWFIFVRFDGDLHAKAVSPDCLELLWPVEYEASWHAALESQPSLPEHLQHTE